MAVQAREGGAAGPRDKPRRNGFLLVRDGGRADASLSNADGLYPYNHAWHTLDDLYSELVPYTAQQQHSALVTAVVAYGAANLDRPLPREGVYLADGLYADIAIGPAEAPVHIMTSLDFLNAPLQTANFVRIVEGKGGGPRGPGMGPRGGGPPGAGPRPEIPPIGKIDLRDGLIVGLVVSDVQKSVAVPKLPLSRNAALKNDAAGVLGVSGPNAFYPHAPQAPRPGQNSHRDRPDDRRARSPEDGQEGRRHPEHPHRPGGPGRPRFQDGRRGVQEAARAETIERSPYP